MKKKEVNSAKLGTFVLAGALFLIFTLYMIGKNRDLLGSTFMIRVTVSNVNGLVPGNNVRFKGIDVGTVKSIRVENDTSITVVLTIEDRIKPYLRKNAMASIGGDGLMGNKLVNLDSQPGDAPPIEEGDVIFSRKPVETDEMLRTLNTTNDNISRITSNLYEITVKLNSSKSLWSILADTTMASDLKEAVGEVRTTARNTAALTDDAQHMIRRFEQGDGLVPRLFTDTLLTKSLTQSLTELQKASADASTLVDDLKKIVSSLDEGEGAATLLLKDTVLRQSLLNTALNIEEGTDRFSENMEAMRSNFLFRGYFRKMEKQKDQP